MSCINTRRWCVTFFCCGVDLLSDVWYGKVAPIKTAERFVSSRYFLTDLIHGFCLRFVASMHWPCLENTNRVFARIYSWLHYGNALDREFRASFCTIVVTHFERDVVEHHLTLTKKTTSLRAFFGLKKGFFFQWIVAMEKNGIKENKKQNWLVTMFKWKRWQKNDTCLCYLCCVKPIYECVHKEKIK